MNKILEAGKCMGNSGENHVIGEEARNTYFLKPTPISFYLHELRQFN